MDAARVAAGMKLDETVGQVLESVQKQCLEEGVFGEEAL